MARPTWNEYFMTVAKLASMRSADPVTKVGAVIVSGDNKLISMGYNGMPSGVDFSWNKGEGLENKHLFVVHAEANAILNATIHDFNDCTLYVTEFPCNECAKLIIQAKIRKIIYLSDKFTEKTSNKASKLMLNSAGVSLIPYSEREFVIVEPN